jgi:hypothetical protein
VQGEREVIPLVVKELQSHKKLSYPFEIQGKEV